MIPNFRVAALVVVFLSALFSPSSSLLEEILGNNVLHTEVALASPSGVVSQSVSVDHEDNHHMWGDWDGWGWLVMVPMMIVFWGGLAWFIMWLVRRPDGTARRDDDAMEIARRRYARGEISSEELEQIRRNLSK